MIQAFGGLSPVIDAGAFVHASAVLIGDVRLAAGSSVWPGAVLRGDMGPIILGEGSNLQDGTICHDTGGISETVIGRRVTVGHRVILHGCVVEDDCLVGMGAIVMDNAVIGAGSFVAAGSLIPPGRVIPPGSFVVGSPAVVKRTCGPREAEAIAEGWRVYAEKAQQWLALAKGGAPG